MGLQLGAFADAEEVMRQLLLADPPLVPEGHVVRATAANLQDMLPVLLVRKIGGGNDYITDFPQIMVTAICATRAASTLLCEQVTARVLNAFNTAVALPDASTALIDGTLLHQSGHPELYENVDVREVAAVYELKLRRPRPAPAPAP